MKGFRKKPRVLVVGGGTLAQALEKSFSLGGITTFRAGRNPGVWHLDLSRDPGCWKVPGDLDWVFVCAGMTSRVECEKQPHLSRWINVGGSVRLARHFLASSRLPSSRIGHFAIHGSTTSSTRLT